MRKLVEKSVPFSMAVALLAACLLAVGISLLVLPDYKGTIEEREQPQNFNLLYLNSGEELNLYPWHLYTGQEPELFEEELVSFAANSVRILGGGSWTDEELYPLIKFRYSGQDLRFLKDMALTEKDGRRYLVNMALDPNGLCYFSYVNQDEREATADEMDKATGQPVYNAIVWQCRRTADIVDRLLADGYGDHIKKTTGLVPDAYFSASKLAWILGEVPGARARDTRKSDARRRVARDEMFDLSLDPARARAVSDSAPPSTDGTCTMCGQMCAMKTVNDIMAGPVVDLDPD